MSRRKTTLIVLALVMLITGSLNILFAQIGDKNVGRNIMRMARQKKTGQKVTAAEQKDSEKTTSQDLMKLRRGDAADQPARTAPRPKPVAVEPVIPTPVTAPVITEAVAATSAVLESDELLNLLPANCLVCVRVNNLDASLGAVDQYISGASPIPVSIAMLAKMQLGNLIKDPMLTDIDTQGDFVVFVTPVISSAGTVSPMPQMFVGMLLPTKGPAFSQSHPDSSIPNTNYALITLKTDSPDAAVTVKKEMLATSLAPALSPNEINDAKSSPAWGYVNIEKAVQLFGPKEFAKLDQVTQIFNQAAAKQPEFGEANAKLVAMYIDILKAAATQLKSLSINITPNPGELNLSYTLSAVPGTDLATLLQKDPSMKSGYSLAGFLDNSAAVNMLAKTNKPLSDKLIIIFTDIFADVMPADQIDNFKALMADSSKDMGDEVAASFSIAPAMPPITLRVIQINNSDNSLEMIQKSLDFTNEMFKSMNMPLTQSIAPESIQYKDAQIYSFIIDAHLPPNATEEQKKIFEEISASNFDSKVATTADLMFTTFGPDADQEIRGLIDQALSSTPTAPTGDIKFALDTIPDADDTEMIASVNVIRLLSGAGKMMNSMPVPATQMVAQMLSQINMPTKSCLCIAAKVENGTANLQVVLPKQHLMEITTVAMQMQQKRMQQNAPAQQ